MTSAPNRGPVDGLEVPRFAGPATFARLPRIDEVADADVAVVGVPFDSGVSYRPGARFGPAHIRAGLQAAAAVQPGAGLEPFAVSRSSTPATSPCNPFDIGEAIAPDRGRRARARSARRQL